EQSLQLYREAGDIANEAISLTNLGMAWLGLGEFARAERDLDAALKMLRANGDRAIEASALSALSTLTLWQGDALKAVALARTSLELARAAQARDKALEAALRLGDAEAALGRLSEARKAYADGRASAVQMGNPLQFDLDAGLARVSLAEGDNAQARAALQPLLQHVADGGTLDGTEYTSLIEWTCYRALSGAGDSQAFYWLNRAARALIAQANALNGGSSAPQLLRDAFLKDVPHHREIMACRAKLKLVEA
ncbi:MAG TPA: hypothetical protein VEZ89_09640, partial [Rubrivivax sp.]|nr:hypothetical protein [Rubrivivax sp.]